MEISGIKGTQLTQRLQSPPDVQTQKVRDGVQPSTIVTISEEAKRKATERPIGNFEDGQGHLSNRAYAQRATDPIFQRIL